MHFDIPVRLAFALGALTLTLGAVTASVRDIRRAAESVSESGYRSLIAGLSADDLEGREPGTVGEQRTVEYLEEQFLELGLQPVTAGGFRQEVPLVSITATEARLSFRKGAGGMDLAFGDDMVLGTRRVRPESSIAGSEVVFVGYGIVAPEYGWNDYAGLDMRGKTALILVNDPGFVTGENGTLPRQGDDLPRPLDLQIRGGGAPGRRRARSSSTTRRPRPMTGASCATAGPDRSSTWIRRTAMPAARRCRAGSRTNALAS